MINRETFCPLIDKTINLLYCDENLGWTGSDEEMELFYPAEYKKKKNWISICRNCENYKSAFEKSN